MHLTLPKNEVKLYFNIKTFDENNDFKTNQFIIQKKVKAVSIDRTSNFRIILFKIEAY